MSDDPKPEAGKPAGPAFCGNAYAVGFSESEAVRAMVAPGGYVVLWNQPMIQHAAGCEPCRQRLERLAESLRVTFDQALQVERTRRSAGRN